MSYLDIMQQWIAAKIAWLDSTAYGRDEYGYDPGHYGVLTPYGADRPVECAGPYCLCESVYGKRAGQVGRYAWQ